MLSLGTICKNHTLDLDFHSMLKHLDILVVDKASGEVLHELKRTVETDNHHDFDEYFLNVAKGFIRLIKKSSDNLITISCEDYNVKQASFLPDVY